MKIISRIAPDAEELQRLRDIIDSATNGVIAPDGVLEPATTLTALVTQVDVVCDLLCQTINLYGEEIIQLAQDNRLLSNHVNKLDANHNDFYSVLDTGVEYDEDLDHATIDMMEAFVASGASEPTFDGELSFNEHIVISKEDFKPIVRQAIESWLRLKMLK